MTLQKISDLIRERQDVILAVFVVSVIFMMIVPLPTWLVDMLIALNMSVSVVLLMVAVYLKSPLDFASFPAVLLITTLFRLSISISTTRLILLNADAGHIVEAFGEFVVGGNLVVGIVIFMILTVVNFVVITKGAERVAEVGARFSLDAMPGKQLSIDADMRNGAITQTEAKILRGKVAQESKLFGSMDGAMKFVKGDAIASIIIVFINLLGGLAIGTLQKGQSAGDALNVYAVLSIGDGLIAQIPALFIAICAGVIVTRVTDEGSKNNLASDIGAQVMGQPRAITIGAAMLLVFAMVPGFPTAIFLALAGILSIPAILAFKQKKHKKPQVIQPLESLEAPQKTQLNRTDFTVEQDDIFSPTTSLLVELSPSLEQRLQGTNLRAEINKARLQIYFRLGVSLPPIEVRRGESLLDDHYRIFVAEIPSADGEVVPNHFLIFDDVRNLDLYDISYTEKDELIPRMKAIWVNESEKSQLESANIRYKNELETITYHAEFVFAKYVGQFIGIQEVRQLLTRMESSYPDLVKEVQRIVPIQMMAELFKRLVQEFVSIRDLRTILSAMIEWGAKEKDPVVLVEHIRISLSRQLSHQYTARNNVLSGILLDVEIEETIRNAIRQTSAGSYLSLPPDISKGIVQKVRDVALPILANGSPCSLITAMDVRRYIRRMVESELPELPVLSYQELATDITLQPVARVSNS
ncbi:MAG: type III secretion system export apparatus subunit SctV [Alphaproteobacteria bacterium]|nr:type III secretion system export apparatus subunit SctV [Alphaproteobacteria bacterium]